MLTVLRIRFQRLPLLVIIGLGLVVFWGQFAHFDGLSEFTYSVEATTQAAATDAANASNTDAQVIYQFSELPTTAQDVFLRAYESPDGRTSVRGWTHRVTELIHTGDTPARPGAGRYYIEYQDAYYEFTLRQPMNIAGPSMLLGYVLVVIGTILGLYGSLVHEERIRALLAHVSGVAAFLTVYGTTNWWGLNTFLPLLVAGTICAFLPAATVWWGYGELRS